MYSFLHYFYLSGKGIFSSFFMLFILGSGCTPSGGAGGVQDLQVKQPNILFLFADDYTFEAIHALGNDIVQTPHLDQLVERGTHFTHAYNMGGWNGAICTASRSMLISGKSLWNAYDQAMLWKENDSSYVDQSWGQLMKRAGYQTYMSGKWHVNIPADKVFDEAKHVRPGMPNDYWLHTDVGKRIQEAVDEGREVASLMPLGYGRPSSEKDHSWLPTDSTHGGFWEGGKHWSEVIVDDALAFIEDASQHEAPFFMYLAFNAAHDPRQSPQEFLDKYPLEDIPLPENFLEEYPYKDDIGNGPALRDEALAPFPRTPYAIKTHIKEYYAIISHLDEQIGNILNALEESGEAENTYIFFTGDHGLSVGHHGLLGKQSMFDHSMRVPLIVTGPEVPANQSINEDVYLQDIMATSLELAGINKPDDVFFNSFMPLVQNIRSEGYYQEDGIYGAYIDLQRMIRKDGFKLIVYPDIEKLLLFNVDADPLEINNLSEKPEYKEKVKQMLEELVELQANMKDKLNLKPIFSSLL